jgi:cation-transporting ATPase 13A1
VRAATACSLFTLAMLLIIEGTVVKQRLYNVRELRQMGAVDERVNVFRKRQWQRLKPSQLVPGDLCAIPRGPVPADVLLVSGTCIVNEAMLTGEAIPQMKESLPTLSNDDATATLASIKEPKLHVVHRGTDVVQVSPPPKDFGGVRCTAESAAVGYVVRTGFGTEQGNLLRTIIGNSDRVSANTWEMAVFILFLLTFAIAASCHVFFARVDKTKKMYKLVVECLLIITAVVPPELPVQLSLAVNNALLKLREKLITCTEPFRIPFAGKLDVCCFDKTGTLTEGTFIVNGVAGLSSLDPHELVPLRKLTALHSVEARVKRQTIKVLKRYHFSSALKRMSTLVSVSSEGGGGEETVMAFCKGAPETLKDRFTHNVPPSYDDIYQHHARQGSRVLALGYRHLEGTTPDKAAVTVARDAAETDLTFAGFLVVSSPIKGDSADAIAKLKASSHHVVMITGDNPLTACHVAQEVGIADSTKRVLSLVADPKSVEAADCVWSDDRGQVVGPFVGAGLNSLSEKHELCITGTALGRLDQAGHLATVLPYATVYARTTPDQKATIVSGFNAAGLHTLMCGDGTNDVGALRRAHVGIALTPGQVTAKKKKKNRGGSKQDALMESFQDFSPPKLGDATMASSFTSRNPSVMVVCNVIRQGRCTLVTSTQMLRILALNCLMNSYGMSVLYLRGVKFGDTQLTFNAFFVAMSMFAVTRSNPLKHLAPQRPADSVLAPNVILSILVQFALHVATLSYMVDAACTLDPPAPFDPEADPESEEGKFTVSLLNTTVYLITWGFTISTIVVNYNGFPFMQTFWQNVALKRSVLLFGAVALFAASGVSPSFCEFLELVPDVPLDFRLKLVYAMVFDVVAAWALDTAVQSAFPLASASKVHALRK